MYCFAFNCEWLCALVTGLDTVIIRQR